MSDEFVASATCVSASLDVEGPAWTCRGRLGDRNVASMISSLKPINWRVRDWVEREWKRMFWSAWTETIVDVAGT